MNYIKCPKCQAEIEGDSYFCDQCGAELFMCPKCGTHGKGKRCTRCGEPLIPAKDFRPAPQASADSAAGGDRQTPAPSSGAASAAQSGASGVGNGSAGLAPGTSAAVAGNAAGTQAPASPSITSDINKLLNGLNAGGNSPAGGGTPAAAGTSPAAGATIRPGAVNAAAQPAAQRQVPGHLVCRSPQLRLYIDEVIIGRREGGYASVFAQFGMVSGRHAQISRTPVGGWQVTDLGSTNGTLLNGQPLAPNVPASFWVGDTITFADMAFEALP